MTNKVMTAKPQIYVACLAAYNNGCLHGRWIDATQEADAIFADITSMLSASPEPGAEEWAVHDYEGFGQIELGEWPNIERVAAIARLLVEYGDAFSVWYSSQDADHIDVNELEEKFTEQCQGVHASESAFAIQLLEDCGSWSQIPEWARCYFDFDSYARDLRLGGDYDFVSHDGQVYVFSNF